MHSLIAKERGNDCGDLCCLLCGISRREMNCKLLNVLFKKRKRATELCQVNTSILMAVDRLVTLMIHVGLARLSARGGHNGMRPQESYRQKVRALAND
jgi:hypothetical protein